MHEGRLIAAIELKSQVGPSFGNNFNNRLFPHWQVILLLKRPG